MRYIYRFYQSTAEPVNSKENGKIKKAWLKFLVYIAKKIYHFNNKIIYFGEIYVYKTRRKGDHLPDLGEEVSEFKLNNDRSNNAGKWLEEIKEINIDTKKAIPIKNILNGDDE